MKINLVYGPPCSGKTTYVAENVSPGEAIYDFDALYRAATNEEKHLCITGNVRWAVLQIRGNFVKACEENGIEVMWVIASYPTDNLLAELDGNEVEQIYLETEKEECYRRLDEDESRPDKDAWKALIDEWFDKHIKNTERKEVIRMNKFWKWINMSEEERVIEIRGTIAEESWFEDEVTPKQFKDDLLAGSGPVTVWINSPGGDCLAASEIYTMLTEYDGNVTVKIDGIAASAASVIAMAGDKVLMSPTALMMIHNPATFAFGDHADFEKAIDLLSELKESIINAYERKTGLRRNKLSELMENETWMNAKKAIELGFADGMIEGFSDDSEAYEFSENRVEKALLNKIVKERPINTGRTVADLKTKLAAIKNLL